MDAATSQRDQGCHNDDDADLAHHKRRLEGSSHSFFDMSTMPPDFTPIAVVATRLSSEDIGP